jgi:hypothetical protein
MWPVWTVFPYKWTVGVMMKFPIAASRTMMTIPALLHHFHLKNYESHQLHQNLHWLCHGLCSQLPACHCSGTGSVPGQFGRDLWWMKWRLDRPFFEYLTGFSLSISVLHSHSISAAYSSLITKPDNWYKHRIMHLNSTDITSSLPPPPPLWSSVFPHAWDGLREKLFY